METWGFLLGLGAGEELGVFVRIGVFGSWRGAGKSLRLIVNWQFEGFSGLMIGCKR